MYYSDQLLSIPADKNRQAQLRSTDKLSNLTVLKKVAKSCLSAHFGASFIYFFSFLFFGTSHTLAVTCGVLAILVSLTPVYIALSNRQFNALFSCISIFNMAPVWF